MNVGLVGLGLVGAALAKRLLGAGLKVTGFDIDAARREAFTALGGYAVTTVADVARDCSRIISAVFNTEQLADVIEGAGGVLATADGKARTIQHMVSTTFWHPDGTPMSAQQFLEALFGKLPEFFKNEEELRALWSLPETRRKLLDGLAEKGFGREQLLEMQKIIDAEKSDLFDVLAHVAYAIEPRTRQERAGQSMALISQHFNSKQQVFLAFVLSHYVAVGSDELDRQGFPRTEIVLSGGLTKTPALGQILANVFNTPVTILDAAAEEDVDAQPPAAPAGS
jgi:hypothetical protein